VGREWALKFVLIVAGVLCLAGAYPLLMALLDWRHSDEIVPMFLSLYVTLGVFLLIAARDPSRHRSLISFAAWSSIAHASAMLAQAYSNVPGRPDLLGMSAVLIVFAVPLMVLAPAPRAVELAAARQV
jgi:Family of unknown function (DUF6632)